MVRKTIIALVTLLLLTPTARPQGKDELKQLSSGIPKLASLSKKIEALEDEYAAVIERLNKTPRTSPDYKPLYERYQTITTEMNNLSNELRSLRAECVNSVKTLAALGSEEAIDGILKALYSGGKTPDLQVEEVALNALASTGSKEAINYLIGRLSTEKSESILIAICEVMRRRKEKSAADTLIGLLSDKNFDVVTAAAKALSQIRSKKAIEPMIETLGRAEKENKPAARGILIALQNMTGEYTLSSALDFHNWWNSKGKDSYKEEETPPSRSDAKLSGKLETVLYGSITSKRVIFICDVSGSMIARGRVPDTNKDEGKQPTTGDGLKPQPETPKLGEGGVKPGFEGTRIEILKLELAYVVNKLLSDDAKFNIIIYSTDVKSWRKSLTPATKENRESAIEFVKAMQPSGKTNIYGALEEAFKDKEVDTIYFLTDGIPTAGKATSFSEILAAVRHFNQGRNIIINTIGLLVGTYLDEDKEKPAQFLKILANENGGTARIIIDKSEKK